MRVFKGVREISKSPIALPTILNNTSKKLLKQTDIARVEENLIFPKIIYLNLSSVVCQKNTFTIFDANVE